MVEGNNVTQKPPQKQEELEELEFKTLAYYGARLIEVISIGVFIFGFIWNTSEILNLTTPQFMMLYGGCGAFITEILARILSKKKS